MAEPTAPIQIILNDEPVTLQAKSSGQPHFLMDVLELSGLDFEHLDRPVELSVNGEEAGFSYVLQEQDQVTIRCI